MRTIIPVTVALLLIVNLCPAQTPPVFPPDRDLLLKGDPLGIPARAEAYSYPSPQKALSFKEDLGLTKDQIRKFEELINNTTVSATVKGAEIIEVEDDFNKSFESGTITDRILRAKLERIGKLRSEYGFIQLQVYLKVKQILSANQYERYKELVHGEAK